MRRGSPRMTRPGVVVAAAAIAVAAAVAGLGARQKAGEWPVYGGDPGGRKYSTLTGITRDNVAQLKVAWEWKAGEEAKKEFGTFPGAFQNTPLMIDGVLYVSTPYNRVVALEAATGKQLWAFDPKSYEAGQPASGQGFIHRGVAAWRDRGALRIFLNTRHRLIASTPGPGCR